MSADLPEKLESKIEETFDVKETLESASEETEKALEIKYEQCKEALSLLYESSNETVRKSFNDSIDKVVAETDGLTREQVMAWVEIVEVNEEKLGGSSQAEWVRNQLKKEDSDDKMGNLLEKKILTKADVIQILNSDEAKVNWNKESNTPENSARYTLALQAGLRLMGQDTGTVDGLFGENTKAAVIAFQEAEEGLNVDGDPGPLTIGRMLEILKEEKKEISSTDEVKPEFVEKPEKIVIKKMDVIQPNIDLKRDIDKTLPTRINTPLENEGTIDEIKNNSFYKELEKQNINGLDMNNITNIKQKENKGGIEDGETLIKVKLKGEDNRFFKKGEENGAQWVETNRRGSEGTDETQKESETENLEEMMPRSRDITMLMNKNGGGDIKNGKTIKVKVDDKYYYRVYKISDTEVRVGGNLYTKTGRLSPIGITWKKAKK